MMILCSKAFPLFSVVVLGLLLAGCDKCGNFLSPGAGGAPGACQSDTAQPR